MPDRQRGVVYGRRPRADGRWQGYVALSGGKRRTVIRPTEAEMRADVDRLAAQLQAGREPPTDDPRLDVYVTRWIEQRRDGDLGARPLALATVLRYDELLRLHVEPAIGTVRLSKLRASHVELALARVRRAGLSGSVRLQVYRLLHVVLKRAERQGAVSRNWCDLVDPPGRGSDPVRELDTDALAAVIVAARGHPCEPMLWVALGTGVRQGELFALRWTDVDLEGSCVHIREKVQSLPGLGQVRSAPKTRAGVRTIALPAVVVEMLRRHQTTQKRAGGPNPHGLVFPTRTGSHHRAQNWNRRVWQAWLRDAGVDPATPPRALTRKASHSLLAASGVNPETIRHRAGHTAAATTFLHYVQAVDSADREAAKRLDGALRKLARPAARGVKGGVRVAVSEESTAV